MKHGETGVDKRVLTIIKDLVGKECCRIQVGEWKTLSIGFGEKLYHGDPDIKATDYYGEWELGAYFIAWRILKHGKIICAYNDDDTNELDDMVKKITVGRFCEVRLFNELDVRITCDNGISIEFLITTSDDDDDDELFHIYYSPQNIAIELLPSGEWEIGPFSKEV